MSDASETPDGAVEAAAQSAGQAAQDQPVMPDGWTGEFDAPRAKATIDRLREFEGQLKKLESDPDAFAEFAQQHGYEFVDDAQDEAAPQWEPQDEGEYEDPNAARIAQMENQLSELQRQDEMQQLAAHVVELTADANLDQETQRYLFEVASAPGYTIPRTEKIVKQYLSSLDKAREAAIEEYRNTKRAPATPALGKPGEPAPDLNDPKTRREHLANIIAAHEQD
jgi:hypothetical protein